MKLINDVIFPEYPSINDCILYEDSRQIIFQLKHLLGGCGTVSKFMILGNSLSNAVYYSLSRWDNIGGWHRIYEQNYHSMEVAKQNLIPLAKYFV